MSDVPTKPRSIRFTRREFLQTTVAAAAGLAAPALPIMAGPFDNETWNQFIPTDKKLAPDWVRSLFDRGMPHRYLKSRHELQYIGMPVGGIGCGTLYLGGDGRLWNWDIFNQKTEGVLPRRVSWSQVGMNFQNGDDAIRPRDGATYAKPAVQADSQAIAQGFAIRFKTGKRTEVRALDASGWSEVAFTGQYPIGTVDYSDADSCPLTVRLEAFSPFVPLNAEESGLPVTIFRFSVRNRSTLSAEVDLAGWLGNATSFHSAKPAEGRRVNRVVDLANARAVHMRFEPEKLDRNGARPDVLVEDFEQGYRGWKREGVAFGEEPVSRAVVPPYQGNLGGEGGKVANSHSSAPGNNVDEKDNQVGRLISPPFTLQRRFLSFYIGGGRRPEVGISLIIDGKVVRTATGHDNNRMRREAFDIAEFEGREATLEIFDNARGAWGNIGVDHILQTDHPKSVVPIEQRPDFGTMALGVVGGMGQIRALAGVDSGQLPLSAFGSHETASANETAGWAPVGAAMRRLKLGPGQTQDAVFVLAWHFPKTTVPVPDAKTGNFYSKRFPDALAVVRHVVDNLKRLQGDTRLWRDTWYDSSLPNWFLDRTFANTSTLATTTSHRFASGRFWGWEGIGCCEGTCTHVWHYGQAMGRLFPELERDLRERVDFGAGFDTASGMIRHRGEGTGPAIDGHCGRILGVWREHQMSPDDGFLKRVWPRVKAASEYLMRHDTDGDGIPDGAQENTLDAAWYGQIAWITSLTLAAFAAVEAMARELGEEPFAIRCRAQLDKGRASLESKLFNGEYFIQIADPKRQKSLGTYEACHIDQVHGQNWAAQLGLGRILDRDKTLSALRALWTYNFAPDVGPFRRRFTAGRPYALAGEAGLVMTSNPKLIPNVYGLESWQIGYFNECMSGFEHQVASHMMAEGMVLESLAITRAIHDRYHASRRNPYNEIECSDHYARAMASYGTYVTACGFETHGPRGHLGFAPKVGPEEFKAAFTVCTGWGTYSQKRSTGRQSHSLDLRHGEFSLKTLALELAPGARANRVVATKGGAKVPLQWRQAGGRVEVTLENSLKLQPNRPLRVDILIPS